MLYVIGGAARAGKTLLAQRLFRNHRTPYFCVDYFVSALQHRAPELGIIGESPSIPNPVLRCVGRLPASVGPGLSGVARRCGRCGRRLRASEIRVDARAGDAWL